MFKRINNWHLSVLVAIVSIFSLALIQQYVFAQAGWADPTTLPGQTPNNNLLVNPLTENLDLNGFDITGTNVKLYSKGDGTVGSNTAVALEISGSKEICINGSCKNSWPVVTDGVTSLGGTFDYIPKFTGVKAIGDSLLYEKATAAGKIFLGSVTAGAGMEIINQSVGYNLLKLNADSISVSQDVFSIVNGGSGNSVFIEDTPSSPLPDATPFVIGPSGRVGIGTATPNTGASTGLLDIQAITNTNPEIDLRSGYGGSYWAIYNQNGTNELNFWWGNSIGGTNRVVFNDTEAISISAPDGQICDVNGCIGSVGTDKWFDDQYLGAGLPGNLSRSVSNAHFLYGTASLLDAGISGAGNKFIWYPNKGAFRAGSLFAKPTAWDETNIGNYSVAFGRDSLSKGLYSVVSGGNNNEARGSGSSIGGGVGSIASGNYSTIAGGGGGNQATGLFSVVSGGALNQATGESATVAGGGSNIASGKSATVVGGDSNIAGGDYSFAGGRNMQLSLAGDRSFVWGNNTSASSITRDNSFIIFPNNPTGSVPRVGIGTASPNSTLHVKSNTGNSEIDIQSGSSPYWGIYQEGDSLKPNYKDLIFWNVNDNVVFSANGDVEVSGNLKVTSVIGGNNNYIQLDVIGAIPPIGDCAEASEGRMIWRADLKQLTVCNGVTWILIPKV